MAPISSAADFERGASGSPTSAHIRPISLPIWTLPNSARANRPRQNQATSDFNSGSMAASPSVRDRYLGGSGDKELVGDQSLEPAEQRDDQVPQILAPSVLP